MLQHVDAQRTTAMLERVRPTLLTGCGSFDLPSIRQRLRLHLHVAKQRMQLAFSSATGIALLYLDLSHRNDAVCASLAALLSCLNSFTSSLRAIVIHLTCGNANQLQSSESSIETATRAASRLRDFHVPIITSICSGSAQGTSQRLACAANHVIAACDTT